MKACVTAALALMALLMFGQLEAAARRQQQPSVYVDQISMESRQQPEEVIASVDDAPSTSTNRDLKAMRERFAARRAQFEQRKLAEQEEQPSSVHQNDEQEKPEETPVLIEEPEAVQVSEQRSQQEQEQVVVEAEPETLPVEPSDETERQSRTEIEQEDANEEEETEEDESEAESRSGSAEEEDDEEEEEGEEEEADPRMDDFLTDEDENTARTGALVSEDLSGDIESSRAFQRRLLDMMVSEAKEMMMAAMPDRSIMETFRFMPLLKPRYQSFDTVDGIDSKSTSSYDKPKKKKKTKKTKGYGSSTKKPKKQKGYGASTKKPKKQKGYGSSKKHKKHPEPAYGVPKPQTTYGTPTYSAPSSYSAPQSTYSAPATYSAPPTYTAPASTYTAPASSYSAPPASSYSAPAAAPAYSAPSSSYSTPKHKPIHTPKSTYSTPKHKPIYSAPTSTYQAPATYEAPKSNYQAPAAYEAPQSNYQAPAAYEAPKSNYQAPAAYEAPKSNYQAPAQTSYTAPAAPSYPSAPAAPSYPSAPEYSSPPAKPQYEAPAPPAYKQPSKPQYSKPAAPARPPYSPPSEPEYEAPIAPSYEPQYPSTNSGGYGNFGAGFPGAPVPSDPFGLSFNFDAPAYDPPKGNYDEPLFHSDDGYGASAGSPESYGTSSGGYSQESASAGGYSAEGPQEDPYRSGIIPSAHLPLENYASPTAVAPAAVHPPADHNRVNPYASKPSDTSSRRPTPLTYRRKPAAQTPTTTSAPYVPTRAATTYAPLPPPPAPTQAPYQPPQTTTAPPPPPTTTRPSTYPKYPAYPPYHNFNPEESQQPQSDEIDPVSFFGQAQPTVHPTAAGPEPTQYPSSGDNFFNSESDKFPGFPSQAHDEGSHVPSFPDPEMPHFPVFRQQEESNPTNFPVTESSDRPQESDGSLEGRDIPANENPGRRPYRPRQRPAQKQQDDPFFSRINDDAYGPFEFKSIFGDVGWPSGDDAPFAGNFGGKSGSAGSRSRTSGSNSERPVLRSRSGTSVSPTRRNRPEDNRKTSGKNSDAQLVGSFSAHPKPLLATPEATVENRSTAEEEDPNLANHAPAAVTADETAQAEAKVESPSRLPSAPFRRPSLAKRKPIDESSPARPISSSTISPAERRAAQRERLQSRRVQQQRPQPESE